MSIKISSLSFCGCLIFNFSVVFCVMMGPLQHVSSDMVSPTSVVASNSGSVTTNGLDALEPDVSTNGMDVLPRCCRNCFLNGVKKVVC